MRGALKYNLLRANGGGWSPLSVSAYQWWNADRTSLISLSGTAVTAWADIITGMAPAQGTPLSQPVYGATSYAGVAPGITFDGTAHQLEIAAVGGLPVGATPCEIWAIVDQTALGGDGAGLRTILGYGGTGAGTQRALSRIASASVNRARVDGGTGAAGANRTGTTVDFSGRHVVRGVIGAAAINLEVDGADEGSTVSAQGGTGTTRTRIGALNGSGAANFFKGTIREIIVTPLLAGADLANMRAYCNARRLP